MAELGELNAQGDRLNVAGWSLLGLGWDRRGCGRDLADRSAVAFRHILTQSTPRLGLLFDVLSRHRLCCPSRDGIGVEHLAEIHRTSCTHSFHPCRNHDSFGWLGATGFTVILTDASMLGISTEPCLSITFARSMPGAMSELVHPFWHRLAGLAL